MCTVWTEGSFCIKESTPLHKLFPVTPPHHLMAGYRHFCWIRFRSVLRNIGNHVSDYTQSLQSTFLLKRKPKISHVNLVLQLLFSAFSVSSDIHRYCTYNHNTSFSRRPREASSQGAVLTSELDSNGHKQNSISIKCGECDKGRSTLNF